MLPRWTSLLKTKRDNHLKHIKERYADDKTPFVIAINDYRLGSAHGYHPCSDLPLAVHAVLPVGHPTVLVDVSSDREIGPSRLQWREVIPKPNGASVPTDNFLNPDYARVSALIGCSNVYELNEEWRKVYRGQPQYIVVHNPNATNPLPQPWLPGAVEYVAKVSADGFELSCLTQPSARPRTS